VIEQAYTRWSATYDSDVNRTRDLDQEVTRQVLRGKHYDSILELGCGTGKNTAFLAEIGEQVTAFDFSEGMLRQARDKLSLENVTFVRADLTDRWPCEDLSAGLVVCNLVLEHIADINLIFAEASRAMIEGGTFFIAELHPFRQYSGVKAKFELEGETTEVEAFIHNLSDYIGAAKENGFTVERLDEWWHAEDEGKPPRIVSFMLTKPPVI